jgi:hypothetical protein
MLEYVFFEEDPRRRFQGFLDEHGVPWTLESRHPETLVLVDDGRLDEALADRLESLYDELFDLEQSLFLAEKPPPAAAAKASGIRLHLKDGTELTVDLPQELIDRILGAISTEELDLVADAVVCAFEDSEGRV